jgi:ribosomal protein S18 acetylase RimI-like enzyme
LKQVITQPRIRSLGLVVIGTSKESRGTGVGSAMLQAFENKGKELNAERLHLSVKKSNVAAIKAYERNGWKIAAEKGNNFEMHKWL